VDKIVGGRVHKGYENAKKMVIGGNKMKMKTMKLTAAFIAALFLAIGCAGGPKAQSSNDGLDAAMRKISDYLNEKIPQRSKVVFLNVKSNWPDLSEYILSGLSENAVNDVVFSVVDRQQLDAIRAELNFQWSGEVSDASAQEIGKMLGAQTIVSGTVTTLGDEYRIQVRAIAVQTAAVQGQTTQMIDGKGKRVVALTKKVVPAGSGGASSGTSTAGGGTAGTKTQTGTTSGTGGQAAQPAAIANGTYTFYPRLRATEGGRDVNAYIDKIVVRGGYLNIYLEGKPNGTGELPHGSNYWYGRLDECMLQDIDNPRFSYHPINITYELPRTLTFEKIRSSKRFSLTYTRGSVPVIFEEIDLSKAQYEP